MTIWTETLYSHIPLTPLTPHSHFPTLPKKLNYRFSRFLFWESCSIFQFLLFFFFLTQPITSISPPNFSANRIYTKLEKKPSNILRMHLLMRVCVCLCCECVCVCVFYLRESFIIFVFESSYGNYEIICVFLFLQNCAIFYYFVNN